MYCELYSSKTANVIPILDEKTSGYWGIHIKSFFVNVRKSEVLFELEGKNYN